MIETAIKTKQILFNWVMYEFSVKQTILFSSQSLIFIFIMNFLIF